MGVERARQPSATGRFAAGHSGWSAHGAGSARRRSLQASIESGVAELFAGLLAESLAFDGDGEYGTGDCRVEQAPICCCASSVHADVIWCLRGQHVLGFCQNAVHGLGSNCAAAITRAPRRFATGVRRPLPRVLDTCDGGADRPASISRYRQRIGRCCIQGEGYRKLSLKNYVPRTLRWVRSSVR